MSAIDVDLLDPAFYADLDDMHETFARLRGDDPVHRDERNGLWAVTRHADLIDVERRAKTFVSGLGYRSFHSPGEDNMIAQDDPRHAEQRGVVARRFTPKAVVRHEEWIRSTVAELVDAVAADGQMEVVDALAARLPGRLTAALLGFPEDRWRDVKSWSERMMRYDRMQVDADALMGTMASIQEFSEVLFPTYAARKDDPRDDLVSAWAQAPGCPYDDQAKLINETGLFISGGAETTRTVIGRGLRVFCDHQDQWEAVAADPSLVPSAVEELIRWVTPLNNFFRTAVDDTTIGDQAIAAGDRIILLYPSANRDEDVFDDPFRFDVRRSPNPHVAFGFGPHVCIGAPLARLELRILFEELTKRFTNLRVVSEPEIEENIFASAVKRFELAFDRR